MKLKLSNRDQQILDRLKQAQDFVPYLELADIGHVDRRLAMHDRCNSLKVRVSGIRKKIAAEGLVIEALYGFGYRLRSVANEASE